MKPFVTDEQIADRIRALEMRLRLSGLSELADEAAEIAVLLEPEPKQ